MIALTWIAVVLIGGAGSVLRFTVDRAVARRFASAFPLGQEQHPSLPASYAASSYTLTGDETLTPA